MFDFFVLLALIGSLFFDVPFYLGSDEAFTLQALALITTLSFSFPRKRQLDLRHYSVIAVLASVTSIIIWTVPVRQAFLNVFIWVLGLAAIAERTEITPRALGRVLLIVVGFNYIVMTFQHFRYDPFYIMNPEISGAFLRPWMMGCFSVIALPFVIAVHPLCAAFILPMAVLSQSWTCLIGFLIIFTLSFPSKFILKFWKIFLAVFVVGGIYVIFTESRFDFACFDFARWRVWTQSFQYIHDLYLGNGLGAWAHEGFIKANGADIYHWRWAHNELYQYFFEQGFLGLFVFGFFVWRFLKGVSKTGALFFLSVFGLSMAHPILHFGRLTFFIAIGFAVVESLRYTEKKHLEQR